MSSSSSRLNRLNLPCQRPFFWNGDSNNGSDDDDEKNEKKESVMKDDASDDEAVKKNAPKKEKILPSFGNKSKMIWGANSNKNRDSVADSGTGDGLVRLGFGDESPRYPHLVGLPVINRPVSRLLKMLILLSS